MHDLATSNLQVATAESELLPSLASFEFDAKQIGAKVRRCELIDNK